MSRKSARENAFRLVFEYCVNGEQNELSYQALCGNDSPEDAAFTKQLVTGVLSRYDVLKGCIAAYSKDFAFDRIYKVDLAILLLASYELLYMPETPVQVAANEAVELCKTYSTDKSPAFVNGVLASVIKNRKEILDGSENN